MDKKSELWIAAGGDELTGTVSLSGNGDLSVVKIALRGHMSARNRYVTNVLLSSIEGVEYELAEIDAQEMTLFDLGAVNQDAIECLLKVVIAAVRDERAATLLVSDTCVKEVLEDVLGRRADFRRSVNIQVNEDTNSPTALRGVPATSSAVAPPTDFPLSEIGKLVAVQSMAARRFRASGIGGT